MARLDGVGAREGSGEEGVGQGDATRSGRVRAEAPMRRGRHPLLPDSRKEEREGRGRSSCC